MNKLPAIMDELAKKHHAYWIDVLRIFTGMIIIAMAIVFIGGTAPENSPKALLYLIGTMLVLGGIMMMIGFQTRIVSLILMPAVVAAFILTLIKLKGGFLVSEILFSVVIIALLVIFFIEGSGTVSVDEFIRNSYKSEDPR